MAKNNRLDLYIDMSNKPGQPKTGPGPIMNPTLWRYTDSMNRAGHFEAMMPASDPTVSYFGSSINEMQMLARSINPQYGPILLGDGIIENVDYSHTPQGTMMHVSGMNLMKELTFANMGFKSIGSGQAVDYATALNGIALNATGIVGPLNFATNTTDDITWKLKPPTTAPFNNMFIYKFSGESVLQALGIYGNYLKASYIYNPLNTVDGIRTIQFLTEFPDNGLTAISFPQGRSPILNKNTFAIKNFSHTYDSSDMYTTIKPFGAWMTSYYGYGSFLSMEKANAKVYDPSTSMLTDVRKFYKNYDINFQTNTITDTNAKQFYGSRERYVQFPQIKVGWVAGALDSLLHPFTGSTLLIDLANLLFWRGMIELDRHSIVKEFISLDLVDCKQIVKPGQMIRVIINSIEAGEADLRIDDKYIVLESTIEATANGVRTTHLEVSNQELYRRSDPYTILDTRRLDFGDSQS